MNFSDRITFVTREDSYYDTKKGEYVESGVTRVTIPCKLSSLGIERTNEIFGSLDRAITVARLQRPYDTDFDYVEIGEQEYQILEESNYRKGVLFLEGVHHG